MHVVWAHPEVSSSHGSVAKISWKLEARVEQDFKAVVNSLVQCVDSELDVTSSAATTQVSKERSQRNQYDFTFKIKVTNQVDSGTLATDVAFQNNIDKSLVSRWLDRRKDTIDGAANKHRQLFKKNRRSINHDAVFHKLHLQFIKTRSRGMKVSFSWFYTKGNIINRELNPTGKRLPQSAMVYTKIRDQP